MSSPYDPREHQSAPQPPQGSVPPMPPVQKKSSGGKIVMWSCIALAIIALALVAFGVAGFFLWKNAGQTSPQPDPAPHESTTTSAPKSGGATTPPAGEETTPADDPAAPGTTNDVPQDPDQLQADFYASLPPQIEKWSTKDVSGSVIYTDGNGGRISFLLVDPNGTPDDPTGGREGEVVFERGSCGTNRNNPEHVTCTIYPKKFDTAMFTMTSKYSNVEEMQRIATAVIDMP